MKTELREMVVYENQTKWLVTKNTKDSIEWNVVVVLARLTIGSFYNGGDEYEPKKIKRNTNKFVIMGSDLNRKTPSGSRVALT